MAEIFFSWTFPVARTYYFLFHAFENEINVDTQDYANAKFISDPYTICLDLCSKKEMS